MHTCASMPTSDPVAPVGRGRQGQDMAADGNGGPMQPQDDEASPRDEAPPAVPAAEAASEPSPEAAAEPSPEAAAPVAATNEPDVAHEPGVSPPASTTPDKTAKRLTVSIAAFGRVPGKWLILAGSVAVVVIVAIAAVLLLAGPSKPSTSA